MDWIAVAQNRQDLCVFVNMVMAFAFHSMQGIYFQAQKT
jgi:hypothetical protein